MIFVLLSGIVFALLSCAVLAHVSMATPLGPWIAPTIVIISGALFRRRFASQSNEKTNQQLALIQTVGSVGGIVAMGIGFTLPMIFFLQPATFNDWMAHPAYFCSVIAFACLSAGGIGIWLARSYAEKLIVKEKLSFPVSGLIYKTITSQSETNQARQLFAGFSASALVSFLRDGLSSMGSFIPSTVYVLPSYFGREIAFGISPMLWSMGFIVGMGIVFPLMVGLVSRYLVLYPLNNHAHYLPIAFFEPMRASKFAMAFCSGLVLVGLMFTILRFPRLVWDQVKKYSGYNVWHSLKNWRNIFSFLAASSKSNGSKTTTFTVALEPLTVVAASFIFLSYFQFGILSQIFMLTLTALFAYQISYFSGRVGLVPFGRFATFVMVPTMFLFKLDYLQITILCVFANICYALATDLLFDYKVGELCGISFNKIHRYQWLGLVVTSLGMGIFLWLLFTNFELGSAQLFAHRARARALLLQSIGFDWEPVLLGFLFGLILRKFKLNPMMVFGGILMPTQITIGLMVGALISHFDVRAKTHEPFWSGIFAGESMWVLFSLGLKMIGA